jgi:hypothetical protein
VPIPKVYKGKKVVKERKETEGKERSVMGRRDWGSCC